MDAACQRVESSSEASASLTPSGTRLHTLLHSNELPKDSELPFFRSIASEMSGRLAALDGEMSRLWDRLGEPRKERHALALSHQEHKRVLSPMRSLPSEILGEIFAWTLPTVEEASSRTSFKLWDSPWNLTHVCSRWRAIAISTPSLWSLLVLPYYKYDYPMIAAETQVQRAQMLRVHFYGSRANSSCLHCQLKMLRYLIQHSPRWEEFAVTLTKPLRPLLRDLCKQVPALRKVLLEWVDEAAEESGMANSVDFLHSADSLVELDVLRTHHTISFTPSSNRLTRYHVSAPWEAHQRLLSLNTTLVEAYIDIQPEEPDWTAIDTNIEMPRLRRLYVSHAEILAHLKMPSLDQITLEFAAEETDVIPVLDKFFADSESNIHRLGLRGNPGARLTEQILQRLPFLTELAILAYIRIVHEESDSDEDVDPANDLIPTLSNPALSPRLSRLHFAFEAPMRFNYDLFHDMVKSRSDGGVPLKAATILFEDDNPFHSMMPVYVGQYGLEVRQRKCANVLHVTEEWMCAPTWSRYIP